MMDYTPSTDGLDLQDVLNKELDLHEDGSLEYHGFHIMPEYEGRFNVQLDGHAGVVWSFNRKDYDNVLDLVQDLNHYCLLEEANLSYQDDKEELVAWAGKIMTSNSEKAEKHPELYIEIPDDIPEAAEQLE